MANKPKIGRGLKPKEQVSDSSGVGISVTPTNDPQSMIKGIQVAEIKEGNKEAFNADIIKITKAGEFSLKDKDGNILVITKKTADAINKYSRSAMQIEREYII